MAGPARTRLILLRAAAVGAARAVDGAVLFGAAKRAAGAVSLLAAEALQTGLVDPARPAAHDPAPGAPEELGQTPGRAISRAPRVAMAAIGADLHAIATVAIGRE